MDIKKIMARTAAVCLLCQISVFPVQAASSPLISGAETAEDAPGAEGPGLAENGNTDTKDTGSFASAYREEELNDGRIEFGELEALIRSGNSTAVNAEKRYENSLEVYQSAYDSLVSARRDMLNKADELEDEGGDEATIAGYDQSAEILTSSVKQMKRSIDSLNSASSQLTLNKTVYNLVKSTQTLMYSYKQMEYQVSTAQKRVEAQTAAYGLESARYQAGLITETDLLKAEKTLLSVQASLQSVQDGADRVKRQLAIMTGKSGQSIEVGEIPGVTEEELAQMNLESDKAAAIIADAGVKSVKRSTVTGDTARNVRRQQLEEAEGEASLTMDELYQTVVQTQQLYEGAAASYAAAQKNYGALQTKYQAGMINKSTWLSGEADWYSAIASYKSAEIAFKQAVTSYQWAVRGV